VSRKRKKRKMTVRRATLMGYRLVGQHSDQIGLFMISSGAREPMQTKWFSRSELGVKQGQTVTLDIPKIVEAIEVDRARLRLLGEI